MNTKYVRLLFSVVLALWASALSAQTHWTCDINAYQYDMTVYYNLQMNGTAITDWGNYEVAAFVGDDCRGVGETMAAVVGEETVHYGYLRVRSNAEAGGETVSFKVYVKNANKEVAIGDEANITFTPNGAEGLPSSPKALNIREVSYMVPVRTMQVHRLQPERWQTTTTPSRNGWTVMLPLRTILMSSL